jgi:hypothetical protein
LGRISISNAPPAPITLLSHVERSHSASPSRINHHTRSRTLGALPLSAPLLPDDDSNDGPTGGRSLRAQQEEKFKEAFDTSSSGHATSTLPNGITISGVVAGRVIPSTTVATPALVISSSSAMEQTGMPSAPPSVRRPRSSSFSASSSAISGGTPTLSNLYGHVDTARSLRDQLRSVLPKSAWWLVDLSCRVRKRSNSWTSSGAYTYGQYELPHAPHSHNHPHTNHPPHHSSHSRTSSHSSTLSLPTSASSHAPPSSSQHGHSHSYGGPIGHPPRPSSPSSLTIPVAAPRSPPQGPTINTGSSGSNTTNGATNRLRRAVRAWTRSLPGPLSPVQLSQNAAAVAASNSNNGVDPSLAADPPSLFRAMSRTPGGFSAALSSFAASPRGQVRSPLHSLPSSSTSTTNATSSSPRHGPTSFAFPPDNNNTNSSVPLTISLSPPMQPMNGTHGPLSSSTSVSSSLSGTNAPDKSPDDTISTTRKDDARRRRKLAFLLNDGDTKEESTAGTVSSSQQLAAEPSYDGDDSMTGNKLDGLYGVTLDLAMRLLRLDEQLRGKETDVQLAAELGQMLLDKNQSLEQEVLDAQRVTDETRREAVERNHAYAELEKQVGELAHVCSSSHVVTFIRTNQP